MSKRDYHHDLAAIRAGLSGKSGQEYWRGLEELAGSERFREFLHREFPAVDPSEWHDPTGRRTFLKLMGASLAFAGLAGCTVQPREDLVPYVKPPEGIIPGKPLFYATAMTLNGVARGLLVESHEGRPTKVEGNPDHPESRGATDLFAQASVLSLYDPDRSQTITYLGDVRSWGEFLTETRAALDGQLTKRGAGLRILTETITSPTLAGQLQTLLQTFPAAKWYQYEPAGGHGARGGAQMAFGQPVNTVYRLENADVILSLDADFLSEGPGWVRYAREFIDRRRLTDGRREMNRLYVVENRLTPTGAKADHRWPVRASEIESLARAVAAGLNVPGVTASPLNFDQARLSAVVRDLQQHRGRSLVIPGEYQPAAVHALAHAINQALGNVGSTVVYTDPVEANPTDQFASIDELVKEMNAGAVELVIILGGNPVYDAPANLYFTEALKKVPLRVRLGLYNDETSEYCHWHVPETHYLEAWGDARAYDGTVSIIQPLIMPLYNGRSAHELLAVLNNRPGKAGYDILREYWKAQLGGNFEPAWQQALHDGVVANSALPPKTVALKGDWAAQLKPAEAGDQVEVVFRPDPSVYDGRFANNGWLQELPKPITKVTWDNVALISPEMAVKDLRLAPADRPHEANGKKVRVAYEGREVTLPVYVQPGHANRSVTLFLGYGRWRAGKVGGSLKVGGTPDDLPGFNVYPLRTSAAPWFALGAQVDGTGGQHAIAATQEHFNIDASGLAGGKDLQERHIIRDRPLAEYLKEPDFAPKEGERPPRELTLYQNYPYEGYAWGMAIDQIACVGCNSCVVACQAENNIPIVGKQQVINGREMHWLRIDTYFKGAMENPATYFQPMLCQHCENAPCEVVCPVNATVHDAEGLNLQVYNRCVGTRYCSNNCPYKVRRFNFLLYNDYSTATLKMLRNPEVTVRSRGVMEKCTYCLQRIMRAKIAAEKEDRRVRDGEVVTACQQACPTEAIIFGDLNDRSSRVAKLKAEPRNYDVLGELNVRPRTSYLAAVSNENPELAAAPGQEKQHG